MPKDFISELNKWAKVHDDSVVISEFLNWLSCEGVNLCYINPDDYFSPILTPTSNLIYKFYNIDSAKLDKERRQLLESLKK